MSLDTTLYPRALWRQTLDCLQKAVKTEWRPLALFVAILFALNFVSTAMIDVEALSKNTAALLREPRLMIRLGVLLLLHGILLIGTLYILLGGCLKLVDPAAPSKPSFENFFYWAKMGAAKYAILLGPLFSVTFVVAYAYFLKPSLPIEALGCTLILAILLSQYYFLLRLMLVSPLAVRGEKEVIKQSWRITKGKCLRIFGNAFVVLAILIILFLIPYLCALIIQAALGSMALVSRIFSLIVEGVWQGVILLATAVYYCVVYHVLSREYIAHSSSHASLN